MLQANWLKSKRLAIGWFVIMSILFFLPGSAFPKQNLLDTIYFDKWVHIGLFAILVFLWSSAFNLHLRKNFLLVVLIVFVYGFLIEIIQREWIPNRSFDLYDVLADIIGGVAGMLFWMWVYRKK